MTSDALLGPAQIRDLAGRLGLRPAKARGQNFVVDAGTIRRIVRVAGVRSGEQVVEVGPGLGSLTLGLLEVGALVTAVEIDPVLARELPVTVADVAPGWADRLTVGAPDALAVTELPGPPTALVASLPYNVAVPVLLTFLARFESLERALVMVQSEVADRLAARRNPPATTADREQVFAVVDAAFAQRRKTLRAALAGLAGSADAAERALLAADVDPSTRGERLGVADFARVAEHIDWANAGPRLR